MVFTPNPTPHHPTSEYVLNPLYCQFQVKWLIWYVQVEAELQPKSKTTQLEHAIYRTNDYLHPELLLLELDLITIP